MAGQAKMAPTPCPKCGGQMYDNIADKAAGRRGPKAPDYACKDRENCNHGVWLKDSEKNALQGKAAAGGAPGGQRRPGIVLDKAMEMCVAAAKEILKQLPAPVTNELTVNMATSLFIARTRDRSGILRAEKEIVVEQRRKAEEAERKRLEEETRRLAAEQNQSGSHDFEDFPGALQDADDDLPF